MALIQIDPPNQKAIRELIRILQEHLEKGSDAAAALEATLALADVGPLGRDAVPALGKALRHEKFFLRQCAVGALSRIGGADAIPLLIFACRDPNEMVRQSAVAGLSDIGSAKVEAAAAQTDEAAAIDRIEKCGARVTIHKSQSGQSSVSVEFWQYWPHGELDAARARHNRDLAHLKQLPHIRSLDLSRTWTSDAGLAYLKGLKELQSLDLSYSEITDDGLAQLSDLKGLQYLDLSRTRVTDAGLVHLKDLTGLQSLNLARTIVTDAGLVHLKGLVQLQSLDLSGTEVTGPGLVNLAGMTRLRKLMLAGRGVAVELGEPLATMRRGGGEVHALDNQALRHLPQLVDLQTLDLSQRSITNAGLAYIGQLKGLQSLNLSNGSGWWSRKLGRLLAPYLDEVTDAGLVHLGELQSLRTLDLGGRSITDAGVPHLNRLRDLRDLRLAGTLITQSGATSLRQALPQATIEIDLFTEATAQEVENLGGKVTRDEALPEKPVIGIDLSKARIGDADAATVAKFPASKPWTCQKPRSPMPGWHS